LVVLDSFRAIAILAVMLHHYLPRYAPPDYPANLYGYAYTYPQWLDFGGRGVLFFFIISGFVIFMTLERCGNVVEFWIRRAARLYPAYVAAMVITFVVVNLIGPVDFSTTGRDFAIGLTFLTPHIPNAKYIDPAYWSLVVELKFYLFIGLIAAIGRRRFTTAWVVFLGTSTLLWVLGTYLHIHALRSIAINILVTEYLPYFTCGMAFYQFHRGRNMSGWVLALSALAVYVIAPRDDSSVSVNLLTVAMVLMFVGFLFEKLEWLAIRPLLFIGDISYSLYLLHQYIGVSLIAIFRHRWGFPDLLATGASASICIVLAYYLCRWVEKPGQKLIVSWARENIFRRLPRVASLAH
jgi:peptidoglycan/LPS O-acetylase OafA/YrhL